MTTPLPAIASAEQAMLTDILRQPQTLADILSRREEVRGFASAHLTPTTGGHLLAVGSGDGWFAARTAFAGTQARAVSGLDFLLNVAPQLTARDRVLAISMSGNVDRTLEGAEASLAHGAGLAILTNGKGGRLGALGAPCLSLDLPDVAPFLCGTASYTATTAVLSLLVDPHSGDRIASALPTLPAFGEHASGMLRQLAFEVGTGAPGLRFLGVGQSVATADYGAAKCVEVTTVPAWSDDIEEFAHRQYWSMKRNEIIVLLPVDARSAHYADATAAALSLLGTPTLALEPDDAPVPRARYRLPVPGKAPTAWLGQSIALQLFAYWMGLANGTDPNRRLHLKEDTERFAVSRRLTRLSLVGSGQ